MNALTVLVAIAVTAAHAKLHEPGSEIVQCRAEALECPEYTLMYTDANLVSSQIHISTMLIENSRFPQNIDIPRNIRAKLGGSPEYWGGIPEYCRKYLKR